MSSVRGNGSGVRSPPGCFPPRNGRSPSDLSVLRAEKSALRSAERLLVPGPDPEAVAKDMADLMEPEVIGFSVFNVPSAITDVSTSGSGGRVLVQIVNHADEPGGRMTIRLNGNFKSVRMYTPENAPAALAAEPAANNRTEVTIEKPARWAAVLFE